MRRKVASLLALGIAVAVPLSAKAAFGGPGRYDWPKHHRSAVVRAEAPPAAILAPARPRAFGDHETDGLSRNPDDCVTYGCIDSGGG